MAAPRTRGVALLAKEEARAEKTNPTPTPHRRVRSYFPALYINPEIITDKTAAPA